jgi:hypothetical protein
MNPDATDFIDFDAFDLIDPFSELLGLRDRIARVSGGYKMIHGCSVDHHQLDVGYGGMEVMMAGSRIDSKI